MAEVSRIIGLIIFAFLQESALAATCEDLNGAHLQAQNGRYLGFFGASSASDSVMNTAGIYGSAKGIYSVRNSAADYGSNFGIYSARSTVAPKPPKILKGQQFLGYLSANPQMSPRNSIENIDSACSFSATRPVIFPVTGF